MTTDLRPAWARWGGGGIILAATLLLLATIAESILARQGGGFWNALFAVLLLGAAIAYALAMVPLALGSSGANGIVGRSVVGKLGLLGFGALFLAAEISYYVTLYLLPPVDDYSGWNAFSLALGIAQMALLLVAAIVVARGAIASGYARFALLAVVVVATVTGMIAQGTSDVTTVTVAHLISTGTQVLAGIAIAFAQTPSSAPARDGGTAARTEQRVG